MMTLKEELEILRGKPIQVFEGDPMEIPCIETSDAEKLCKHPVVSVHMITYNHEPYISQAIEGVMMQQTDFEFELIIGEDCSQDKTREICFEYQKKYPDKIRVLWWHENVSKLGGNSRRVTARCRGEFIAFCEGDDYWTDPLKLQKQVDLIRETNSVVCVAFNQILEKDGQMCDNLYENKPFLTSADFFQHYFHTSTYLFRAESYQQMLQRFNRIPYWYDTVLMHCMMDIGKCCLLPDVVSVRRITGTGIATSLTRYKRTLLGLSQAIPLYLFGPLRWKSSFACSILSFTTLYFYKNTSDYSFLEQQKYAQSMMRIFWIVIKENWFRLFALKWTLRMIKRKLGL